MTYDQYWNGDCCLPIYYRKAHEIKKKQKNEELWLQGAYIYDALCRVSPILHAFAKSGTKPQPYPNKPYDLTEEEIQRTKEEQRKANRKLARAKFEAWASSLNLPSKKRREVSKCQQ